jgi:hypothetical protein
VTFPDAAAHARDAPRHCPACGAAVSDLAGLVVEYWRAEDRVFSCWCRACGWTGEVVPLVRTVTHESG